MRAYVFVCVEGVTSLRPAAGGGGKRRTMSMTRSRPVAKAMAFGGVDTGSRKASEQVRPTGSMK